jgi:hypothetical protein
VFVLARLPSVEEFLVGVDVSTVGLPVGLTLEALAELGPR